MSIIFAECPPGFFVFDGHLFLKTECDQLEAYNAAGERFWGGVVTAKELAQLMVQPCDVTIENIAEEGCTASILFLETEVVEW